MKRNPRLAIIHVARKQLGLTDEAYRAVLSGAGVASARDISTEAQFSTVMAAFENMGFVPTGRRAHVRRRGSAPGAPGMISKRQEAYIRGLWALASRARDERSLARMAKRIGKADDISFLTRRAATDLILALRDICRKAGHNPDGISQGEA